MDVILFGDIGSHDWHIHLNKNNKNSWTINGSGNYLAANADFTCSFFVGNYRLLTWGQKTYF